MKTLLGLLILASSPAFAHVVDLGKIVPQLNNAKIYINEKTPKGVPTDLQPIRMAQLKVRVTKTTIVNQNDGTISQVSEDVCMKTGQAEVYDIRGLNSYSLSGSSIQCDSTLTGKPVTVSIAAGIYLVNTEIFPGEGAQDLKFATAALFASGNGAALGQLSNMMSGSRDLNTKSFMGNLGKGVWTQCEGDGTGTGEVTCKTSDDEFFSATVELID